MLKEKIEGKSLKEIIIYGPVYLIYQIPWLGNHIHFFVAEILPNKNRLEKTCRHILGNIWKKKALEKSVEKFRKLEETSSRPEREFIGWGNYLSVKPMQTEKGIEIILNEAEKTEPGIIAEIGTARGGTLYRLSKIADKTISIDIPASSRYRFVRPNEKFLKEIIPNLEIIRNDSHSEETEKMLENKLEGESLDVLLIDGDHSYEGVKDDYKRYKKYVRDGGKIIFHDIHTDTGVSKFWEELDEEKKHREYDTLCGIGVINR